MPIQLLKKIKLVEDKTMNNNKLVLSIFFNYSGVSDILYAVNQIKKNKKLNFTDCLLTSKLPDVDLLIRTGNEKRISNFMLWQLAYAEIIFEKTL
jgi:undecaprenyl diphosphate synthase